MDSSSTSADGEQLVRMPAELVRQLLAQMQRLQAADASPISRVNGGSTLLSPLPGPASPLTPNTAAGASSRSRGAGGATPLAASRSTGKPAFVPLSNASTVFSPAARKRLGGGQTMSAAFSPHPQDQDIIQRTHQRAAHVTSLAAAHKQLAVILKHVSSAEQGWIEHVISSPADVPYSASQLPHAVDETATGEAAHHLAVLKVAVEEAATRLTEFIATRFTQAEKRQHGLNTHKTQSELERSSTYQYMSATTLQRPDDLDENYNHRAKPNLQHYATSPKRRMASPGRPAQQRSEHGESALVATPEPAQARQRSPQPTRPTPQQHADPAAAAVPSAAASHGGGGVRSTVAAYQSAPLVKKPQKAALPPPTTTTTMAATATAAPKSDARTRAPGDATPPFRSSRAGSTSLNASSTSQSASKRASGATASPSEHATTAQPASPSPAAIPAVVSPSTQPEPPAAGTIAARRREVSAFRVDSDDDDDSSTRAPVLRHE